MTETQRKHAIFGHVLSARECLLVGPRGDRAPARCTWDARDRIWEVHALNDFIAVAVEVDGYRIRLCSDWAAAREHVLCINLVWLFWSIEAMRECEIITTSDERFQGHYVWDVESCCYRIGHTHKKRLVVKSVLMMGVEVPLPTPVPLEDYDLLNLTEALVEQYTYIKPDVVVRTEPDETETQSFLDI